MSEKSRYIISGGGTGGHIFPAISIANELRRKEPECKILFVGAKGRMEMEKVPAAGYEIKGIPVAGLKRSLSLSNLKLPFLLARSISMARKIIGEFRPDVVIGVGGYASAPTLWSAQKMRIPTVIQEQNSYAGLTNRIVGKKADRICVAYENMERFFPSDRIILTGNPIRSSIRRCGDEEKRNAKIRLGLDPDRKLLFIVGGSLGSGTLNNSLMKWASESYDDSFDIIWQYGRYYAEKCSGFLKEKAFPGIKGHDFIREMDMVYAAADLVVSRAGAGTISELAAAGKATIFVPSPNVTEDHQRHNAMALVNKGAALMIEDAEAPEKLMKEAVSLLDRAEEISSLEKAVYSLAMPDAASEIADQIIKLKKGEK